MTSNFIKTKSTAFKDHVELVQLISEESALLENETSPDVIKRHTRIISYLIELQSRTAKELV